MPTWDGGIPSAPMPSQLAGAAAHVRLLARICRAPSGAGEAGRGCVRMPAARGQISCMSARRATPPRLGATRAHEATCLIVCGEAACARESRIDRNGPRFRPFGNMTEM